MYYISMRRSDKIGVCFFAVVLTVIGIMVLLISLAPDSQKTTTYQGSPTAGAIFIGLMGLAGLIFGVVLFFAGFGTMKKKKLMQSLPTSKIRSLAIGIAEIYGKVVPDKEIMKSPFSNRDCVGAKIVVEELVGGGSTERWVVVKKLFLGNEFFLQDDTGMVLVQLDGAEVDIPVSYEFGSGPKADPPHHIVTFLKKHNFNFERLWENKILHYSESIIKPGDELYILGRADDNPNFRDGDAEHGVQDLMMQQGHNPDVYFISTRSKKQILGKLKYKVIAEIFGGPFLIGGGLLIIALALDLILN